MVARTPPKLPRKMVAPLNPVLLRETLKKVDQCMARLQELQYTVTGGKKVISGVTLSPRSTRGYLKTSLRCKQESLRIKSSGNSRQSPTGKLPSDAGEWRRMSLPAMLLGETVGEIIQASQFAREIVNAVASKTKNPVHDDPKTPMRQRRNQRPKNLENSELRVRRRREKQSSMESTRSESDAPPLRRAKSRINFKVSPVRERDCDKENCKYIANRVSPRHRPWARKTVLFPNPLFHSSPTSQHQKFGKTRSPVITRNRQTPHKFLIKSPPTTSKFQVKIKSPPLTISPTRPRVLGKKSPPKISTAAKLRRSFSPSRLANKLTATPSKLRRSFSPSRVTNRLPSPSKLRSFSPCRLANKLVSPLKGRKTVQTNDGTKMMSGLRQRPISVPMQFSSRRT